ncbi:hypothetical protein C8J55DRAFT_551171 [Lentinula edodes]|uniref:BAG domain-containing protein n=1 Tax=Lentinula lateritia TaxID=40482 RepID=A0A9W9A013_9AGAR|nr:hypothetical protein C8J55DRAFT_551171 [Lentinula edodes]
MYRFQPTYISSLPTDLGYSRPPYSRQRYLSPFTEQLRAAEAQREEEELLRRLEEIQLQKQQQDRLLRRRSPFSSYSPYQSSYLDDDELERFAAVRRPQQELEFEYIRRREEEEARLLALKRNEEELRLQQLKRLREEEEARLAILRREAEKAEAARQTRAKKVSPCYPQDTSGVQLCQLFGPQAQQLKQKKPHSIRRLSSNVNKEPLTLEQLFSDFVQQINNKEPEREQTVKPKEEPKQEQEPKRQTPSPARESVPTPQTLEEVLRLLFNPQSQVSSPVPEEKVASPPVQEKPKAIEVEAPRTVSDSQSRPVSSLSLKEQLEARLNNDQSNEIKDTIQAVLASLAHAQPTPTTAPVTSSPSVSSHKGKEKASEPQPEVKPTPGAAHKALESVRNIEASLTALQDEFEFPSEVDFSPAPSRSSSPVRDDISESDTVTLRKLAYTARNHPIRSYEQALSRLLVQLDEIESHGNADVRISRKAVVARVEGALEELEHKVESRWHKWNQSRRVEREEEVEEVQKKVEDAAEPSQEDQAASAPDDVVAVQAAVELSPDLPTASPSPASPSAIDVSTDDVSQRPSYAEVAKHHLSEASRPADSSFTDPDALPPVQVTEHIENSSSLEASDPQAERHSQEEVVLSDANAEEAVVAPVSRAEDNVTGTEAQAETLTEPEVPASSYPPTSNSSEPSSYPPVSSASTVAPIRPPEAQVVPDSEDITEDLSSSAEISEDVHPVVVSEESEAEVVDTFLLPEDNASDVTSKQSPRDLEDVGSDWSEVDA